MRGPSARTLVWVVLLVVAAVLIYRLRHGSVHAEQTLPRAAIPVAARYAADVVSAARCGRAASLADSSLGDPCQTFRALHGEHVVGQGRLVRGCGTVADRIRGGSRLSGADCVRFGLAGPHGTGRLHVWLARRGGGWEVSAAASELHRA